MTQSLRPEAAQAMLRQASQPAYPLAMSANSTFVGVGTTGSLILLLLFRLLGQRTKSNLPLNSQWASIDSDGDGRDPQSTLERKVRFLPLGQDGAGTVISNGRDQAAARFPAILRTLRGSASSLMNQTDPRFPVNLPGSQSQTIVVIAGSGGGCSGGTTDLVVTAAHLAAHAIGLERFDLVLVTVGPTMPGLDVTRQMEPARKQRIAANSAENDLWVYSQMATRCAIKVDVPGHGFVKLPGATRIASKLEFDWASETTKLETSEQLNEIMAASLFHRFFTAVGCRRSARHCDDFHSGLTGQKHPILDGVLLQ